MNIKKLLKDNSGRQHDLYAKYINPQLVKVLKTVGFDKNYVRANGPFLYDADGNEYLDFLAGYGVFALGRSHPAIIKALEDALHLEYPNMVQLDAPLIAGLLAERLLSYLHDGLNMVFFTNSGAESNEGAIKFARKATGRNRIVYLNHAFHGLTTGTLAINGGHEFRQGFGTFIDASPIELGDLNALENELKKEDVAAFFFEPIQGKGVFLAEPSFYREAQTLCHKYGTMFICDEVQSGFGRTGKMFAHEHFGLKPDIVTAAKALSGGFVPVGAIFYNRDIYDRVFPSMEECVVHSNTFGRNIMAMAAGFAVLDTFEKERVVENSAKIGDFIINGLRTMSEKYEMLMELN